MQRPFTRERRFPRFPRECDVLYSVPSQTGVAHLCDISHGGLGIQGLSRPIPEGTCLPVTVAVGFNRVGPFAARVVWSRGSRAGLEIDSDDPEVERRISQALRYLEPI